MNSNEAISEVLLDYLRSAPGRRDPLDRETDLLASGLLDSLLVMDLVCFLEARYQIKMLPGEVSPDNLRSVARLADYVIAKLSHRADAA